MANATPPGPLSLLVAADLARGRLRHGPVPGGLKATDPELAQASRSRRGQQPCRESGFVTLPQLREVNLIVLAIVVIDSLRTFDIVWVMTGGGPNNASQLLSVDMYMEAFS